MPSYVRAAALAAFVSACAGSSPGDEPTPPPQDAGVEQPASRCPECELCSDEAAIAEQVAAGLQAFEALTDGLPERPIEAARPEATNGTLNLGVNPAVVPIVSSPDGTLVAASALGEGRVVAFSSQDFLSSGERSTLLGQPAIDRLVVNAARWVAPFHAGDQPRILADNHAVAQVLTDGGIESVEVAGIRFAQGLEEIRNWDARAIGAADVLVVQVNEWGTSHIDEEDVATIRSFVEAGGGLLIAGSALHWKWWLSWTAAVNQGDAILEGSGISWRPHDVPATDRALIAYDALGSPAALWCSYVNEDPLDAPHYARLQPLFDAAADDERYVELDLALWRLIQETPRLSVAKSSPAGRLSADVGALLGGQTWAQPHPWAAVHPGVVQEGAPRIRSTTTLETRWKRWRPLGVYAPPGEPVTVRVPAEFAGTGLRIRLGELHDDLRSIERIETWERAPLLTRSFPLEAAETVVGTGLGGSMYLWVPEDYAARRLRVETDGGVRQAVFRAGMTNQADFVADLAGGAPVAILEQEGAVRFAVKAAKAAQVDDLDGVVAFWTGFYESHRTLSQEPNERPYESDWAFDPQVGYGYANATTYRINHPELATDWVLRTRTGDEDWWLFAHELGHQFQTSNWRGGDITEVAVNLFSLYTINFYLNDGGDQETRGFKDNAIDHEALRSMRWGNAGLFDKLELYRQLVFEFGWDAFRQTFASYYAPEFPEEDYGVFMDGFASRFSQIVERDITPFLDHWEYPLSDEGRARVRRMRLPAWLPPGW